MARKEMDPHIMQKAINSAREALQHAAMHEQKGLPASASTILTIEMVRISAALKHFSDMPSRNSRILEDTLERCRARESHCRAAARRQMQTYGLLYKQGHFVKNWQTRLFILSGGQLKYYVPGDTEAKGTIMLHHIKSVVAHTARTNGFKIETHNKQYFCQAPDEMSLQAWMLALRPLKVGFLMKQGQEVQSWKKRWCMVWRTQLAYFENHNDVKERKGYILLRDCIPDRLFAVPRSVFGHDNIFQVETSERTFFMQAISGEDMQEWLDHINTAIASRGPANGEEGDGGAAGGAGATMQPAIGSDDPQMLQDSQPQWSEQQPNGAVDVVGGGGYGGYDDPTAGDGTGADQRKLLELQERERRLDEQESILSQRESILESKVAQLAAMGHYITFDVPAAAPAPAPHQPSSSMISESVPPYQQQAFGHMAPAPAPAPTPAAGPRADQALYSFLVASDDLFADERKCQVYAASLEELEQELTAALGLTVGVYVLTHDEDFDEFCLPDSIEQVPNSGRVKVKART